MNKACYSLCALLLFLGFVMPTYAVTNPSPKLDYVADELLIQFKASSQRALRNRAMLNSKARSKNTFHRMGIEHWQLPTGSNLQATIKQLRNNPSVQFVEPNYRRYLRLLPDDPKFSQQWALQNTGQTITDNSTANIINRIGLANADMALSSAWNSQTGSKNVVVAVVDDSVDLTHPDLAANIWVNPGEIANDGIDNDANGYIDDVHGWDFINNDNDPSADLNKSEGHGTLVAGCIGAVGNNTLGITGVNWQVSIMALKTTTDVASELLAFQYAINKGAHIINASWGGPQFSRAESNAVTLLQNAGILLVAAAGNYDTNNDIIADYPSSLPHANVLAVAGSDPSDQLMSFSHYGALSVDIAAPGLSILTTASANAGTTPNGALYQYISGTSFSSPYVAGIAALIKAQYPAAKFQDLKGRILASATPIASMQGFLTSSGRAHAANALSIPRQPVLLINKVSWNDAANGVPDPGETIDMVIQLENTWQNATGITATLTALSANFTVLIANTSYPTINTDAYANPITPFQVHINTTATGQQTYRFRLDIQAAGAYAVSRYYQFRMGNLQNGITHNGTLMLDALDDMQFFHIDVPAGVGSLTFSTTSGSDLDLLIRPASPPQFDYQLMIQAPNDPFAVGINTLISATIASGNENKTITNPVAGTWYAAVVNFDKNARNYPYSIRATYTANAALNVSNTTGGKTGCLSTAAPTYPFWLLLIALLLGSMLRKSHGSQHR